MWDMNRFWDRATLIRVMHEQVTNQVGPKRDFELLWKKMTNSCSDRTSSFKGKSLVE
jgi:hypothetical protein